MGILDLVQADGNEVKRKTSAEYSSRCPYCGGKDRFVIWPDQGKDGKWWCRQCGRRGDAIQYLRDVRKMSFTEACHYVGREISNSPPSLSGKRFRTYRRTSHNCWVPRETTPPTDTWQGRAKKLIKDAEWWLFQNHPFALKMLGWLREERGLSVETIKAYRLGLIVQKRFELPSQWGLEPLLKADGKTKKIVIPRGLSIPFCQDSKIHRIRIRRPKMDLKSDEDNRYHTIRGSDSKPMILEPDREIQVVVESDLDAILVVQEAKGLVGAVSLGSAQKKPDKETATILRRSQLILVALDNDDPGGQEAWGWWLDNHFPQARRLPPIDGKDPGEMWEAGVNLREWIEAGISYHSKEVAKPGGVEIDPVSPSQGNGPVMEETAPKLCSEENIAEEEVCSELITQERSPTCFECGHFRRAVKSPNPSQAWGHCEKRKRGRYGVATACEALLVLYPDLGELKH